MPEALEIFSQLFEEDQQGQGAREAEHEQKLNDMYAEFGPLSARLSWTKPGPVFLRERRCKELLQFSQPLFQL